jgi:hypothetical protein
VALFIVFAPIHEVAMPNKLAIVGMKWNTFIEHKKAAIVCEESGLVSVSYNGLIY